MSDALVLRTNGKLVRGWTGARVRSSMETAAASFALEIAPPVGSDGGAPSPADWPFKAGDRCALLYGRLPNGSDRVLLDGHIDKIAASVGPQGRRYEVSGRSLTADLVDCSATNEPSEWQWQTVDRIAAQLAEPFGVEVLRDPLVPGTGKFPLFKLFPGESPWEAIERACRMRGVLAYGRGDGVLVMVRNRGTLGAGSVVEGENVVEATAGLDMGNRFSEYVVTGQNFGNDDIFGGEAAHVIGRATDETVSRKRSKVILAEGVISVGVAEERAQWEATFRAARSSAVSVTVNGWNQIEGGDVWRLGFEVPTRIPSVGVDQTLRVAAIEFSLDAQRSETTRLGLVHRDAYLPQPAIEILTTPFSAFTGGLS